MPRKPPSPAQMAGSKDPALSVRPVDYFSWPPTTPQGRGVSAPPPSRSAAAPGSGAHPTADAAAWPGSRLPATAAPAAARPGSGAAPKPGPGTYRVAGPEPGTPPQDRGAGTLRLDPEIARWVEQLRHGIQPGTAAPASALYTAESPGTGVPELELPADGMRPRGVREVTERQLRLVVAEPEDTWTSDLGRTDYYVRGRLCAQVDRAEHRVVGIYRSGWALARRPDETWGDGADFPDRTGAKPGGSGTRYPTNRRELLARLKAAGFHVTTSGPTHGKITHPDVLGRFIPFSSTPSSQRYGRHVVTAVKRVFGVDLRD